MKLLTPHQLEHLEIERVLIQVRLDAIESTIHSLADPSALAIERAMLLFQQSRLNVIRAHQSQPPSSSTSTGVTG